VQTADVVELREQLRETLAAIQLLPTAQRDALLLRELEGRSHEEIAVALGVTAGGARQHLHRARMSLRAAASAITPYPLLTRILNAAADGGARNADLVSGAGMGVGAGALKAGAGLLAAGAIAGGAVGVHHHRTKPVVAPAHATAARHGAAAHRAAPVALATKPHHSASPTATHGTAVSEHRGTSHRVPVSEVHRSGSNHDGGAEHEAEHHGGSGSSGEGSTTTTTDDHSGPGGGDGSDDGVTTTATTDDNSGPGSTSSGSGSDDGTSSGSSGPGSGETETTTTTTTSTTDDHSGSGSGSGTSGSDRSGSDDGRTTTTDG